MHNGNLLDVTGDGLDVAPQFVLVRVAGEGIQRGDPGSDLVGLAKNINRVPGRT